MVVVATATAVAADASAGREEATMAAVGVMVTAADEVVAMVTAVAAVAMVEASRAGALAARAEVGWAEVEASLEVANSVADKVCLMMERWAAIMWRRKRAVLVAPVAGSPPVLAHSSSSCQKAMAQPREEALLGVPRRTIAVMMGAMTLVAVPMAATQSCGSSRQARVHAELSARTCLAPALQALAAGRLLPAESADADLGEPGWAQCERRRAVRCCPTSEEAVAHQTKKRPVRYTRLTSLTTGWNLPHPPIQMVKGCHRRRPLLKSSLCGLSHPRRHLTSVSLSTRVERRICILPSSACQTH